MSEVCRNCGLPVKPITDPWGFDNYRGKKYGFYHPTVEQEQNIDGMDVMVYAWRCPDGEGEAEPVEVVS